MAATYNIHPPFRYNKQRLPVPIQLVIGAFALSLMLTPNPLLSLYALLVLLFIFDRLWLPGHPPIFFVGLSLQWLQAATRIWQANIAGLSLEQFDFSLNADDAVFIALSSLLVFSWVGGYYLRKTKFNPRLLNTFLSQVNLIRAIQAYFIALLVLPLLNPIRIGGLAQIIYSIQGFKWALYALMIMAAYQQNKHKWAVLGIFFLEFILGFAGYFSQYREVVLISVVVFTTIRYKIKSSSFFVGSLLATGLFVVFVVWTGVKQEYRYYLRGGEAVKSQTVVVSSDNALRFLSGLISNFNKENFNNSMNKALDRLQYTQMIQRCIDYVPAQTPHENGKLWLGAITHVFTPRILFPNKEIIDDSARARLYTGVKWSLLSEGTSISIGYISESYVDFGRYFFWIPIVFLAWLFGNIYKYFLSVNSAALILNIGALISILFDFHLIERSGNKLVGGILMAVLVNIFIIQRFFYPMLLRFLLQKSPRHSTLAPG